MATNLNLEPDANTGRVLLRWTFREFRPIKRNPVWWVAAGIITAVIVVWATLSGNFLFALILLIGAVLFVNETRRQPRRLDCHLTTSGVVVGKKFWRWSELTNFWIAYHPPRVTNLYLVPKNPFDPRVTVPLEKTNPLTVREHLTKYLTEDLSREDEPTSEAIARALKLQ